MANVERMITGVADYTLADLEALEEERPELGRLEVIDGALHATGESAVGNLLRYGWWLRLDGVDHTGDVAVWQLQGWPELRVVRDELFARGR